MNSLSYSVSRAYAIPFPGSVRCESGTRLMKMPVSECIGWALVERNACHENLLGLPSR
jgi:hypothetical protein